MTPPLAYHAMLQVAIAETRHHGGIDWLREHGVEVIDLRSNECIQMLSDFTAAHPDIWYEDIGE